MAPRHCNRWVQLSSRLYGWIVRVYPRAFREEYGAQMRETFGDRARMIHRKQGLPGLFVFGLNTLKDSAASLYEEHQHSRSNVMNQTQLKSSWLYLKLWEPNTYWTGMIMGALFCAQALCGAGLIFFSYVCGEGELMAQIMGWWLIAFLPIQLFYTARDLKKKPPQTISA